MPRWENMKNQKTFLSPEVQTNTYKIPGYQIFRKDRLDREGGGILVYIKNSLSVKKREDTHKMAEANKAFAHYRW